MLQPSCLESYKGSTCFAVLLKLLLAVLAQGASDLPLLISSSMDVIAVAAAGRACC